MKKLLLSSSLLFSFSIALAQEEPTTLGEPQVQNEELVAEQTHNDTRFGIKAGYSSAAIDLGPLSLNVDGFYGGLMAEFYATDKIIIQPEVLYSRAGEANIIYGGAFVKYYVVDKLSLMAGPQLTYFIGEEDDDDKSLGIDIAAGVGFDITKDFFIDAKYAYGLTQRGGELSFLEYTVNSFLVGVGYKF